jgi:YVTN family beta-propeller protein
MRRTPTQDRVLATVMFTDIVGSTERAASMGDRGWRDLVARHHRLVRAQLKQHRGREIDTAGDGFFAIFDRPAQAIVCAIAIIDALRPLGLEIRAGLHFGEVEPSGRKVGGIAVHTAARVLAAAEPGEILVTATMRDLVAGSGIDFTDRGVSTLKGVPGEWRLFAVTAPPAAPEPGPDAATRAELPAERAGARPSPRWLMVGGLGVLALLSGIAAALISGLFAGPIVPVIDTVARVPSGDDAFDLALQVGSQPSGLATGEGAVWVINFNDKTVSQIDPAADEVVAIRSVGGTPTGVAVGGGVVWMTTAFGTASGDEGSVMVFNPGVGQVEATIPVGTGAAAIAFGEGAVWVADRLNDRLLKIDPRTQATEEIGVGRAPGSVAIGDGSVWVTSTLDHQLWRIDPVSQDVIAQIGLSAAPSAVAIGEGAAWVTSETGDSVTRIDIATDTVVTTVAVGDGPTGVAVAPDGIWVAVGRAGKLVRVDPATNEVATTLAVGGAPLAVTVDERGAVWISVGRP